MKTKNNLLQGSIQQLRFLLFEIGLAFGEKDIEQLLLLAEQQCLQGLKKQRSIPSPQKLNQLMSQQALSLAYQQHWQQQLAKLAKQEDGLWNFLSQKAEFRTIEQWASLAETNVFQRFQHCSSYSLRELMLYEPQFQSMFRLHWCALKKSVFGQQSQWEQQLKLAFPELYLHWQQQLSIRQLNPADYLPCPVHPIHWRHQVFRSQADHYQAQDVIIFPHFQSVWTGLNQRIFPVDNNKHYFLFHAVPYQRSAETLTIDQHLKLHCQINRHPLSFLTEGERILPLSALSSPSLADKLKDVPARKKIQDLISRNNLNLPPGYLILEQGQPKRLLFEGDFPLFSENEEVIPKLKAC